MNLNTFYRLQNDININSPERQHIIGLSFAYSLGLKKILKKRAKKRTQKKIINQNNGVDLKFYSINSLHLNDKQLVNAANFNNWKKGLEQVDDVCVIGIKL